MSVWATAAGVALPAVAFAASFLVVTQISGGAEPEPERNAAPSAAGALSGAQEEVADVRPAAPRAFTGQEAGAAEAAEVA